MKDEAFPRPGPDEMQRALEKTKAEIPHAANVIEAFEGLFTARARVRMNLPDYEAQWISLDPASFRQGAPAAGKDTFVVSDDLLGSAADELIPAMQNGFPLIGENLRSIHSAISEGNLDLTAVSEAVLLGKEDAIEQQSERMGVPAWVLSFTVGQLLKPFAEKRSEAIARLIDEKDWSQGYCPVCGSLPYLSILAGKEGQRLLVCSFCGHRWKYMRTACPFCGTDDSESLEFLFSSEREHERIHVCHKCKKYIPTLDVRDLIGDIVPEAAALGVVHLDVLAQDQGYSPGAVTEWNVLRRQ